MRFSASAKLSTATRHHSRAFAERNSLELTSQEDVEENVITADEQNDEVSAHDRTGKAEAAESTYARVQHFVPIFAREDLAYSNMTTIVVVVDGDFPYLKNSNQRAPEGIEIVSRLLLHFKYSIEFPTKHLHTQESKYDNKQE